MLRAWGYLVLRDLRESYPNVSSVFGEAFLLLLSLVIYGYTAKAFGNSLEQKLPATDTYFTFILIGETALFIPFILFEGPIRVIRSAIAEDTWDQFVIHPQGIQVPVLLQSLAYIPRQVYKITLTFVFAALFFSWQLTLSKLLILFFGIFISLPIFLGMGLIAAALLIYFGRGASPISYLSSISSILAGAYFPLAVFPKELQEVVGALFPFTIVLQGIRNSLVLGWSDPHVYQPLLGIFFVGLFVYKLGCFLVCRSIVAAINRGVPFLLTS